MSRRIVLACVLALASAGAGAEEPGRYQLERSGDGWVRLDRTTGAVSYCEEKAGAVVCRVAADERDALLEEIGRLAHRLDAAEERLVRLEGAPPSSATRPPTEEEFEKSLGYMERFMRRFMGIVKDLEREYGGGDEGGEADPGRT